MTRFVRSVFVKNVATRACARHDARVIGVARATSVLLISGLFALVSCGSPVVDESTASIDDGDILLSMKWSPDGQHLVAQVLTGESIIGELLLVKGRGDVIDIRRDRHHGLRVVARF